ncbi:class I SAM-dependent methyltransferase [uncultured Parolsenella sp.]|uniref:class I SAM-dependent methyltransferase n=1 Tax=uncultured Parolsenella sp. TaxID=2083008 RepID=UPI002657FF0B|nr:class I SAM-dependent methyltransferase [uncultured Parolsenella sp.]
MTPEEYKQLSIREFTEAARAYDSDHAGIYEMCRDDYPQMLAELEKEPFDAVLDVGCGTGAVLALLHEKYPDRRYVGLDLTPEMIEVARTKVAPGMEFVVGDAENLPFDEASFDAVLCSNSFHHYPNPAAFLAGALRVLRPGGRLILRDYTSSDPVVWLMNHVELPLARLVGHGDVRILRQREFVELAQAAGFEVLVMEAQKGFRAHLVARRPRNVAVLKHIKV